MAVAVVSERAARSVAATTNRHKEIFQRAYDEGTADAVSYLRIVLKNNPETFADAIQRDDVQYMLRKAAVDTWDSLIPLLEKSMLAGALMGHGVAEKTLRDLGVPVPEFQWQITDLATSLHKDLQRVFSEMPTKVSEAFSTGSQQAVDAAWKSLYMRTYMIGEASVRLSSSEAQIAAMRGTDTLAMWKTTSILPCKHCRHLDGQVREWGEEFDVPGFSIYGGALYGPQLHPHCRCILVAILRTEGTD